MVSQDGVPKIMVQGNNTNNEKSKACSVGDERRQFTCQGGKVTTLPFSVSLKCTHFVL